MKFCSLSSGSSGNCIYLESDKSKFLIDAGFSGKQVENLLRQVGIHPQDLDFILVTHEHTDHARGVGVLSRRYNIPIFANEATWLAMDTKVGKMKEENRIVFTSNKEIEYRDLDIFPMRVYHDSAEAVGYVIEHKKKKITLMTDTGFVSEEMMDRIRGSSLYYIEANHDPHMLETGPYPFHLQERIRSVRGHLSNLDCGKVLGDVLQGMEDKVVLGHLSKENNLPLLAKMTVESYLTSLGLDTKKEIQIQVAARSCPGDLVTL